MGKAAYASGPKRATITNLLGGQSHFYIYGSSSSSEVTKNLDISPSLVQNHVYYFACLAYATATNISVDFYWPITEPVFMSNRTFSAANTEQRISGISTRSSWSSGTYACRLDNNCNRSTTMLHAQNFILVDLTAAFGSGYEPGQSWCDSNIPYFTGSMLVDIPTYTPPSVARKVTHMYVGVNNVAQRVIKGYIGVNGVARLFFYDPFPLTVTANAQTVHRGGSVKQGASYVTASGLRSGDVIASATLSGSTATVGTTTVTPTSVIITRDGRDVTNHYAITYASGTLTVQQTVLTVSIDEYSFGNSDYTKLSFACNINGAQDDKDVYASISGTMNTAEGSERRAYYKVSVSGLNQGDVITCDWDARNKTTKYYNWTWCIVTSDDITSKGGTTLKNADTNGPGTINYTATINNDGLTMSMRYGNNSSDRVYVWLDNIAVNGYTPTIQMAS